ncbi:GNAT family N-acetyltransferase [Sporosarcina sp. ANT_H38]|uniref:GNAT family N-acetyltransferase n=1 Tax=Sporosarcina sp. ANT_H38 TaxID=2597358 RepID=UPI0011F3A930|nr:GNAT family N-acetyltransferase [Sporosarcina sp. ANT_H38]KAA0965499.1 GNAT family N-acetyltransferase [Sporosarcina sp. ANT_H38]
MKIIAWNRNRLEELVELWNKELADDFPMREELFIQNSFADVNVSYDSSFIAVDDLDRVIGFVVAKRWQEQIDVKMESKRGWIQVLLVDSAHRGKGMGTLLLERVEAHLKGNGVEEMQLGGDPFHYFSGIPNQYKEAQKWVEQHGYAKRIDTYDLINHLDMKYDLPADNSIAFSILKKEEEADLILFLERCFPGRWVYETMKYFEMNGDGREFVVVKKKGQIIGFCRINDSHSPFIAQNVYWSPLFEQEVGGIGPLGIDVNEQKQGYGLGIVQAAIAYLQERNIKTIIIDWTILVDFYKKLDFNPWKSYGVYLKDISKGG